MALEAKLVQKLSQSLLMTPQLQQAIKLLQLGRLEYIEAIQNEILENPILEELKESDGSKNADSSTENDTQAKEAKSPLEEIKEKSTVDIDDYLANFHDASGASVPKGTYDFSDRPSLESTATRQRTLKDHLADQLQLIEVQTDLKELVYHIAGNLDRRGYLCCSVEELAQDARRDETQVLEALQVFREIEPAGLAARNLQECLLLQLEARGLEDSLSATILRDHLPLVEKRGFDKIAKELKVDLEAVFEAMKIVQSLDPRPGAQYAEDDTQYITPDIYVYKDGRDYVISLNEDGLPRLRISPYYLEVLKENVSSESRTYLNDRIKAASWLIKSIHQRQQTIYKVTESIVKFQRAFLDEGIHRLKPMVLKDVADDIGMHESTVSRVTTNKFVHTPQGVFELKFFFTTGLSSGTGEVSSSAVKERIKQIIAAEQADKPISDQAIVELLAQENITIARRTVAKYRESLGILSSSKRKRRF